METMLKFIRQIKERVICRWLVWVATNDVMLLGEDMRTL